MDDEQLEDLKETIEENSDKTKRRNLLNPMFWVGLSVYITGFLLCCTVIGLPIGVMLISGGRSWMYKNTASL